MADNISFAETNRPFSVYRFVVKLEKPDLVVGAFTSFSGIKMRTQMVQARVGNEPLGVKDNFPGITEYDHVTLSKGVIGDNKFLDWLFNSTFPSFDAKTPGTIGAPKGSDSYRNLRVIALTETMEEGIVWTLINAIPAGYTLAPMDASRSEVLVEEIEFAIAGVTRTVQKLNDRTIEQKK